jgi:choline dehydrogenase-like flavoprotein
LDSDVCVIGAGPAGISVCLELIGCSQQVILVESGSWREDSKSRNLMRGFIWPEGSHEPLEANRRRQFGGTSAAWGGRCIQLDPLDFKVRPWIPLSGWPLNFATIEPYYARALTFCEAGRPVFSSDEAFPDSQAEMIAGFDGPDVASNILERWSPPTHFAKRYAKLLEKAKNVTVLLNSTVVELTLNSQSQNLEYAQIAVSATHRFLLRARRFVLAAGGLENARLLLVSGFDKLNDNVGRYYMSHLTGSHSSARLADPNRTFMYEFERDRGIYVRRRIWITEAAQCRHQIGNAIACFEGPFADDGTQTNGVSAAVNLAKFAITLRRKRGRDRVLHFRRNKQVLLKNLRTIVSQAPRLAFEIPEIIRQRYLSKRRLPILVPAKDTLKNRFRLFYQAEHAPNPKSRLMLHKDRDALGVPRLEVRVAFSEVDVETVVRTHKLIEEQFRRTATGQLFFEGGDIDQLARDRMRTFDSAGHYIGTTRMSDDRCKGVVDRNCRFHGIHNLFVAGSSVFPTSGHANPTLTIVALALRLADHLKGN